MCRDGFTAPCEEDGCRNVVRCRDLPRLCPEHDIWTDDSSSDEKARDESALPRLSYLIIETLAARYRVGEYMWTFPNRFTRSLRELASAGWIGWKSGIVERTCVAWLTDAGLAAAISADYRSPIERLRAELARKDQAIDEIRALQLALEQEAEADAEEIRADGGFPHYDAGWNAKTDAALRIERILSDLSEHQEGDSNG
jgi:hypothetical protein